MTITAHAGAMGTAPNTLESVRVCAAAAGVIEVDVRFLGDAAILGHDKNQGGPLLEDCLKIVAEAGADINLDLKERSDISGIAALVRQYGLEGRAFFTGVCANEIAAVVGSGLAYYLNCAPRRSQKSAASLVKAAKELGAVGLNIQYRLCSRTLVKEAHAAGLLVSVWTVDKAPAMRRMIRLGVDNITTRRPDICEGLLHAI